MASSSILWNPEADFLPYEISQHSALHKAVQEKLLKLYEHYTLTNKGSALLCLMLYINSSYKAPFSFLTFKTTLKMYIHRKQKFFLNISKITKK